MSGAALEASAISVLPELLQIIGQSGLVCGALLRAAAIQGHAGIITALLEAAHTPEQLLLQEDDKTMDTALTAAVRNGHAAEVEALLTIVPHKQIAVTSAGSNSTPLHLAVESNSIPTIRLLLRHSPDEQVMQRDKQGDTPLHLAVRLPGENKEVVDLLLRHSPEKQVMLGNAVGQLPLVGAACGNKWEIMRLLLVVWPGRQVLHRDENLNSALAYAADLGHAEAVRLLLAHSPDHQVLQSGQGGHNALTLAVLGGHQEVVRLLLEHSPLQQVAHRLESGVTAPMLAAARGDADVLQMLLLYVGDTGDLNAALAAIQVQPLTQGHRRCCQLLFMHGASAAALPTAQRAVVENVLRDVLQQYQVPSIIDRAITGAVAHK